MVVNETDMVTGDGVRCVAAPAAGVIVTCAGEAAGGTRDNCGGVCAGCVGEDAAGAGGTVGLMPSKSSLRFSIDVMSPFRSATLCVVSPGVFMRSL